MLFVFSCSAALLCCLQNLCVKRAQRGNSVQAAKGRGTHEENMRKIFFAFLDKLDHFTH